MSEFHLDYCFMLFFDLLYKILLQFSKFIRSLRLVKSLSNWKPMTNTYHRGLDFFQIPLNGVHSTQKALEGQTSLCCSCELQGAENNASHL